MSLDPNFLDFVHWFGVPGAMMFTMLAMVAKGTFVTGREHRAVLQAQKEMREDYEHRLDVVRKDRDFWRDTAIANMSVAEKAACAVEHVVTKLPTQKPPSGE